MNSKKSIFVFVNVFLQVREMNKKKRYILRIIKRGRVTKRKEHI